MAVSGYLQASSDLPVLTCEHGSGAVLDVVAKRHSIHTLSRNRSLVVLPVAHNEWLTDLSLILHDNRPMFLLLFIRP
jgi:hypothetical protein